MLKINQIQGGILVEGIDNSKYPFTGKLILPANSVIMYLDDNSDMVTFKSVSNNDTLFSGLLGKIEMNGTMVSRGDISDTWDAMANTIATPGGDATNPSKPTTASLKTVIVTELPATGEANTIYLIEQSDKTFKEYIWLEERGKFEEIGNFSLDLSDYYTKGDIDSKLSRYLTKTDADKTYQPKGEYATQKDFQYLDSKVYTLKIEEINDLQEGAKDLDNRTGALENKIKTLALKKDVDALQSEVTTAYQASDAAVNKVTAIEPKVSALQTKVETLQPKGDYALKSDIPAPVDTSSFLTKETADGKYKSKEDKVTLSIPDFGSGSGRTIRVTDGDKESDVYIRKLNINGYVKELVTDSYHSEDPVYFSFYDMDYMNRNFLKKGGIKTVNGQSLVGSGDITIQGGVTPDLSEYIKKADADNAYKPKSDSITITGSNGKKASTSLEIGDSSGKTTIYSPEIIAGSKSYKPYGFVYFNEKPINFDNLYQVKGEYATKGDLRAVDGRVTSIGEDVTAIDTKVGDLQTSVGDINNALEKILGV